jgi:ribosomal protein L21
MEDKMFAVIKTGGKQFRVTANDRITTAKIEGNPGDTVAFDTVLMLTDGEKTTLDAKALSEITVAAEIVEPGPRRQGHRLQASAAARIRSARSGHPRRS